MGEGADGQECPAYEMRVRVEVRAIYSTSFTVVDV